MGDAKERAGEGLMSQQLNPTFRSQGPFNSRKLRRERKEAGSNAARYCYAGANCILEIVRKFMDLIYSLSHIVVSSRSFPTRTNKPHLQRGRIIAKTEMICGVANMKLSPLVRRARRTCSSFWIIVSVATRHVFVVLALL